MMDLVQSSVRRWEALKGDRGTIEQLWQECAELVWPQAADFTVTRTEGEKRGLLQFDASAADAANQFASGMWGNLTNSATDWLRLRHPDDAVNDQQDVKLWMDGSRQTMQQALAAQGAGFYTAALQIYKGLGVFGTAVLYVDEVMGAGRLRFSPRSLSECCIAQDDLEMVNALFRQFKLKAHQVMARADREPGWRVPDKIRKAVADGHPDAEFTFLHAVEPNDRRNPSVRDARGMAFRSVYTCLEDKAEPCKVAGFREFPFMVPRWGTVQRGLYGESPVMSALTDVKVLNEIEKTKLRAGQMAANPPLLAPDENAMLGVKVYPGGITYGGVTAEGRAMVQPLQTGADFRVFEGMAEQKREAIRMALHNTVMLMTPRANATATEVLEQKEERLRLLGPQLSRVEQELLEPLTGRVFSLLWRADAFPPTPDALATDPRVKVEYVSQLAIAQKSGQAAAVMRALSAVMPMAQADPSVLDNLDLDEAARQVMDGYGAPPSILRDPKLVAAQREQRAAQAAQMQQAQMIAAAAKPARDYAAAGRDVVEMQAMEGAPA